MPRVFGLEVGVMPTEDAKVLETYALMAGIHSRICCLVDGDPAGLQYARKLQALASPPAAVIRWQQDAMIEDAVGWILAADEVTVISALRAQLRSSPQTVSDVVRG